MDEPRKRIITPREAAALVKQARENQFRYFEPIEIRAIFNFGIKAMRLMLALNPPMIAEKINPADFKEWLTRNWERVGKTTDSGEE